MERDIHVADDVFIEYILYIVKKSYKSCVDVLNCTQSEA